MHEPGASPDLEGATVRSSERPGEPSRAVDLASAAAGAATGARAVGRLGSARDVLDTITRLRRVPAGTDYNRWLREVATRTRASVGPDGKSGALGQLKGHLFELLDVRAYNQRGASRGAQLRLRSNPHHPGYDATRFIGGRFAGGVQHKLGAGGIRKAAAKLEAVKPRSAARASVRVPADRAAEAVRNAAGVIRVEASEVTTAVVAQRAETGLGELARYGGRAASGVSQAARAARRSAVVGLAVGAAFDLGRLRRGDVTRAGFVAARGVDAAEAAATSATSVGVGVAIGAIAHSAALAGGVAVTVAASPLTVPAASLLTGVAIAYAVRPVRRRVEALMQPHDVSAEAASAAQRAEPQPSPGATPGDAVDSDYGRGGRTPPDARPRPS